MESHWKLYASTIANYLSKKLKGAESFKIPHLDTL